MRLTAVNPSAALLALGSTLLFGAAVMPQPAGANMMQQIITGKCAEAMQADFNKVGKTPPAGMVDYTCTCVADGMLKRRQSLDKAKTICVQQATTKYGRP